MHSLSHAPLNIALMDCCPLTLCGLSYFIGTLAKPGNIILQEISLGRASEALMYQPVDILITELNGRDETLAQGREILLRLCEQLPQLRVIVYTSCQSGEEFRMLLCSPNISVIARDDSLPQVAEYFNRVFAGERVLSPLICSCLARQDTNHAADFHHLTRSENDVLKYLFNGMSLGQIAELQHRSIKTISAHKCNAMRKLRVKNDVELFLLKKSITQRYANEASSD